MKKQIKADLMLLLVTLSWGLSYYFVDRCLTETSPLTLCMLRFSIAFILLALLGAHKMRSISPATWKYSGLLAVCLFGVYLGATLAVQYTTLSNAAFLCSLTVLLVPLLEFLFWGRKPTAKMLVAFAACLIGIMLLTLQEDFSINMDHLRGDLCAILCAVFYAFHLLVTDRALQHRKADAFQLGILQLGGTGILMAVGAFSLDSPTFRFSPFVWAGILFLAVFCTGFAFLCQALAQRYTPPSHVGVIFSLEPVFAGLVAYGIAGEVYPPRAYVGMGLILFSVFLMEIPIKSSR